MPSSVSICPRIPLRKAPGVSSLVALLLITVMMAGCARLGLDSSPPKPESTPPAAPVEEPEEELEEEEEMESAPEALILDEAWRHFDRGQLQQAGILFQDYLRHPASALTGGEVDTALWGLAMVFLLPESPIQDQERGTETLERLTEEFGTSVHGAQARWILGILAELEQVQTQVAQQEDLLRQLNETVEQLKRIDLNRRPAGSSSSGTRPDSLPRP